MIAAVLSLASIGVAVAAAPVASASSTSSWQGQGLFDLENQQFNWTATAHHYKAVILNDWKARWGRRITAKGGVKVFVYKDLTSTRETDCGTSLGGGQSCIVNGVICPHGVKDARDYAGGIGFCWAWRHHRNWFLRTSSGQLLTESGFPTQYVMNFGNRGYQEAWLRTVAADAKANGWKYVFGDNAVDNNGYGTPAKYPTAARVQAAMFSMLKVVGIGLRKDGIKLVPNLGYTDQYPSLWGKWIHYVGGFQNQHNVGDVSRQLSICESLHKICLFNQTPSQSVSYYGNN